MGALSGSPFRIPIALESLVALISMGFTIALIVHSINPSLFGHLIYSLI